MKLLSFFAILFGAGLIGYGIGINQPIQQHASTTPKVIQRCSKDSPVKLEYGSKLIHSFSRDDLWEISDKVTVAQGRHQGQEAIPIDWFFSYIGKGSYLEILPCKGDPYRIFYDIAKVEPKRYLIVQTGRKELKLLDMNTNTKKPILKKIHLFRIHYEN